jgi:hypothetical protein
MMATPWLWKPATGYIYMYIYIYIYTNTWNLVIPKYLYIIAGWHIEYYILAFWKISLIQCHQNQEPLDRAENFVRELHFSSEAMSILPLDRRLLSNYIEITWSITTVIECEKLTFQVLTLVPDINASSRRWTNGRWSMKREKMFRT